MNDTIIQAYVNAIIFTIDNGVITVDKVAV